MTRTLSTTRGTAMLLGGVLGPGVLVLPRLASEAAGPASVLAWAGMLVLSLPVALTFAALGERHPDGGGVAHFARLVFGRRAAIVTGLWFYCAVPIGTVAGAIVGGHYAAAAFGAGPGVADLTACALLAAAVVANTVGLHASGRVQTALVLSLAALLAVAIVLAAPHVQARNYKPFASHGVAGIAGAVGVLVFASVGWEAVSHLSAEFDGRGLRRATIWTLVIVGLLYLGLSLVSTGTGASRSAVPLQSLLASGIGGLARPLTGVSAIVLTFGAVNTYIASAARLGASLARERVLPGWFADAPEREPRRSLALLAVVTGLITAAALLSSIDVAVLIRATSACLAAVTALGMAAATRLLPPGGSRRTASIAAVLAVAALACCGAYLLIPVALLFIGRLLPAPPGPDIRRDDVAGVPDADRERRVLWDGRNRDGGCGDVVPDGVL